MKKIYAIVCLAIFGGCAGMEGIARHADMAAVVAKTTYKAARPISDEEEYFVGRAVSARILSTYRILDNRALTEYVNLIGQTVAMHSEKPFLYGGYHFVVLDTGEANAFACPGGMIFITKGMINMTKNEEELASVIAHEVAHVNHRDGISAISSARWTETLAIIGTEAAKKYGPEELSRLVNIFEGAIDDVFKTLVVRGYGRSQELSADEASAVYLSKAGYKPSAIKDFLSELLTQGQASDGGILKTHPATSERVENIKGKMPEDASEPAGIKLRARRFKEALRQ